MAIAGPGRRRTDARDPKPRPFGPTLAAPGPADPDGVRRSLEQALETGRRLRRPLTLIAMALPAAPPERVTQFTALVRHTVRDTDGLWPDGKGGLIIILTDVDGPNSEPALARLRLRLKAEGMGAALMGRAAPAPGISAADLLALAHADLQPISRGSAHHS